MKHPKIEIVQRSEDLNEEDVAFLKSLGIEQKDVEHPDVQSRMMATAVFMMLTNPDAPLGHKKDVFEGWSRYMHCFSQMNAYEKISEMPEHMKTLPEEVRTATAMLICAERAEKAWQTLHNLVTVLNPSREEEK